MFLGKNKTHEVFVKLAFWIHKSNINENYKNRLLILFLQLLPIEETGYIAIKCLIVYNY